MIRPRRSSVFLLRPISAAFWRPAGAGIVLGFFLALKGKGTFELSRMNAGDEAELAGPLGNAWAGFPPARADGGQKPAALVGGGAGVAPLVALAEELSAGGAGSGREAARFRGEFDFYAGFRKSFADGEGGLLEKTGGARRLILAFEDSGGFGGPAPGRRGAARRPGGRLLAVYHGRIPDFFDPAGYSVVYACGPEPMLRALASRCARAKVPCYVSLERRMACGVGACLGCTVETRNGNKRCCADGPIFPAEEIYGS
jgi:NAD(P)H-flavin reductase